MSLFSTTFRKQVKDYLPPVVRGSSLIDYLYSLSYPVETELNSYATFVSDLQEKLQFNGQKMVMQAGVNVIMGEVANTIIIEPRRTFNGIPAVIYNDGEGVETAIVSNEGEFSTMVVINTVEETANPIEFEVQIPVAKNTAEYRAQVSACVDLLKVAGTRYEITTY